jgi:hypothetical protein
VIVKYVDSEEGDWQQGQVIVYADGYNAGGTGGLSAASVFETLETIGIIYHDQAWKYGRYHQAVAILRPEQHSLLMDWEYLACRRGQLVHAVHDVPQFGLGQGRIKEIARDPVTGFITAVMSDEQLLMEEGQTYAIRITSISPEGTVTDTLAEIVTVPGMTNYFYLAYPADDDNIVAVGDLFLYGYLNSESVELIVRKIVPQGDLSAQVFLVDHAPGVQVAQQMYRDFLPGDVDIDLDTINIVKHGFYDDDELVFSSTGTLPGGISVLTSHYVVNKTDDSFQISTTKGGSPINITSQGSGTHTATVMIPAYDPQISKPGRPIPLAPVIKSIRADFTTAYMNPGHMPTIYMMVLFDISEADTLKIFCEYRQIGSSTWMKLPEQTPDTREIKITPVTEDQEYEVRLRVFNSKNYPSPWTTMTYMVNLLQFNNWANVIDVYTHFAEQTECDLFSPPRIPTWEDVIRAYEEYWWNVDGETPPDDSLHPVTLYPKSSSPGHHVHAYLGDDGELKSISDLIESPLPIELSYDLGGTYLGKPTASETILYIVPVRAYTLPVALAGSKGIAKVAATAETIFTFKKNGTAFGTMTFAISGTVPTFAAAAETSFNGTSDILEVVAPATPDATLDTFSFLLKGLRD